jgi:dihydrofolate reductase
MSETFLYYGGSFIIVLVIQSICCLLIKNKYLRHAGLALLTVPLVLAVLAYFSDPGFIIGGNVFVMFVFLAAAACGLAGYGAAWGIHCLIRRIYRSFRRRKMNVSMIAAVGRNLELGKNNALLWRLEGDLPFFKQVTMGKTVIMGRKTYESMGRALPGRRNIVITRDKAFSAPDIETARSPMAALDRCAGDEEVFIIGGGQIYAALLPLAKKLYLTEAEAEDPEADTYFPAFDKEEWERTVLDEGGGEIRYTHVLYERKKNKK